MHQKNSTQSVCAQADNTDKTMEALLKIASTAVAEGLIAPAGAEQIKARYALGEIKPDALPGILNGTLAQGEAAERGLAFLSQLFGPLDVVELQAIGPAGEGSVSYCGRLGDRAQRDQMAAFINTHNGVRNVYFGVNTRCDKMAGTTQAASNTDVRARQVVALDMDFKDAPDADPCWLRTLDALRTLGPTAVVNTGNGAHVHFRVERIEGTDATSATTAPLKEVMSALGSDDVSDLRRVMRLPDTINLPSASKLKRGCVPVLAQSVKLDGPAPKPRPLADLCRDLNGVAERLGLPGRGEGGSAPSAAASHYGATGERKTGQPAPSAEVLRVLAEELPNEPGGPFDARDAWVTACGAFKGAASEGGFEAEGRDVFVDWSETWGCDPSDAERVYDSWKDPHMGWGALMQLLEQHGTPAGVARVRNAVARSAFPTVLADEEKAVVVSLDRVRAKCAGNANHAPAEQRPSAATRKLAPANLAPVQPFASGALPPREWLLGTHLYRNNISLLVGQGGTGKSALAMLDAAALATGKTLMPGSEPHKPLRVLYYNGEDNTMEQQRRLAGVLKAHGLKHGDLGGRLFLASHSDLPIWLGGTGRSGAQIEPGIEDALVGLIERQGIDVVMLDPFGALHGFNENANDEMNLLLGVLRRVVHRTRCAMLIVHHAGKWAAKDMQAAGAGASRGASAILDAARSVRQLSPMTAKDVSALGCGSSIPEEKRSRYVRIGNGKSNLAPADKARWMFLDSVGLGNVTQEYPAGDTVQAAMPWEPPVRKLGSQGQLASVQTAIAALPEPPRKSTASPDWVGNVVAQTLQIDIGPKNPAADRTPEQADERQRVNRMVKDWVESGGLVEFDWKDAKSIKRPCIRVGKQAEPLGGDADASEEKHAA